ncbi:MAG: hypothetical protein JW857_11235 [Bacteroidales bacterium]|nr:hypothetical protein [Bacteroidales bacterium]
MKNCFKKTIPYILICLLGFLLSCNAITKRKKKEKSPAVKARVDRNSELNNTISKINSNLKAIEGRWEIVQNKKYSVFSKVIIVKLDEKHYQCTKILVDGSKHSIELVLNPNYELHSFNRIGEYYKLSDDKLLAMDNDGIIASYTKNPED